EKRGIKALTAGLMAIAAGDSVVASKQAKRASSLLRGSPLALVLGAQAAQLSGDAARAKSVFETMCEHDETAFMGYRGLMNQALEAGDITKALALGGQAQAFQPDAPWLVNELVALNIRAESYGDALRLQEKAIRRRMDDPQKAKQRLAEILMLECHQLWQNKDYDQALRKAREALQADDTNRDAQMACGRLLASSGAIRKAQKLLMRAWERDPNLELARALGEAFPPETAADEKLKKMQKLLASNPEHISAQLILAEMAIASQEWQMARTQLDAILAKGDHPHAFRLMAQLEEGTSADIALAHKWLQRATDFKDT
ncbi:MAG: tetratricopeptide repeat protein, partial [Pseudomonadota bacterium]